MLKKYSIFFCLIIICLHVVSQENKNSGAYYLVYVALTGDDYTNYNKLTHKLRELNFNLRNRNQRSILYFSKGMINFTTDNLDEWGEMYRLINGNSMSHINVDDELRNLLNIFRQNDFAKLSQNNTFVPKYEEMIWDVFVGKGYWLEDNHKNILGTLITACGINNSFRFRLNIFSDSTSPIVPDKKDNILGKYYGFISENNVSFLNY